MPDIDKLIKAWEIFRDSNPYEICNGREFRAIKEPEYCMGQMIEDTITLLREQPKIVRCRDCKYYDTFNGCMSWHDVNSGNENWYCADGEEDK